MKTFLLSLFLSTSLFAEVSFNKDIRPILSKYCFHCHGPDDESREKKLRLDISTGEMGAYRTRRDKTAIKPGDALKSHVYLRIISDNEDKIMPPPESKKEMNAAEIALIKEWIEEGAEYRGHWAFEKPKKKSLPVVKKRDWTQNEIDYFILSELEKKGLSPSDKADKRTLIRRLYLDLTGMSPTLKEVNDFLADESAQAYEKLVDQILTKDAHAERLALDWLDTARYSDTNGYSIDDHRDMWAWRDWVIKSFMDNKPYDQFVTEQVAGDLLVTKPIQDRPETFWIWKKDLQANEKINLKKRFHIDSLPKEALLKATCDDNFTFKINGQLVGSSEHWNKPLSVDIAKYLKKGHNDIFVHAENQASIGGFVAVLTLDDDYIVTDKTWQAQLPNKPWAKAVERDAYGKGPWAEVLKLEQKQKLTEEEVQKVIATGFLRNGMNTHEGGTLPEEYITFYHNDKVDTVSTTFMGLTTKCAQCHDHKFDPIAQKDFYSMYAFFNNSSESGMGAGKGGNSNPVLKVNSLLTPKGKMIGAHKKRIAELRERQAEIKKKKDYLGFTSDKGVGNIEIEIRALQSQIDKGQTSVMIMDWKEKKTHVRIRGQYDQLGEEVSPAALGQILAFDDKYPKNRLGLAQWILAEDNPLTARVAVNRYWQLIFGTGIVKTAEDFGSQGEYPSHLDLLDSLAIDLRQHDWDIRRLIKNIVMSATYQQSSRHNAEAAKIDPYNRLHHRAPSFRLTAEFVRDNALMISGLLDENVGGPSVYPVQPLGLWAQISHFGHGSFTAQAYFDGKMMRRSMYSVIKRTGAHPAMAAFDAPSRETCTVRRQQTNTPLQSLVMLNDPQFTQAAEALAIRMKKHSNSLKEQLQHGFILSTGREPNGKELQALLKAYDKQLEYYKKELDHLMKLSGAHGDKKMGALIISASLLLNLSESMTRN
ncbi:PSD1 and planctomycete cytochrome C domain-containing protein [Lentisphaera profundi]|uniref:PSD1 and planctomycete cytochrome C domain-containing protein n=1 Tax=Lentisphaera profundi TaxID=1658616 RepID=A0ABY7VVN0_9BACT|nr:PSD1 and planctomycete cytochrome C domain-containing protein [Lentisphaera profundi]WDE97343.1 PSD1 and planctomycete cytochrome C domain-containing protein [Lentisphaera profundi]